MTRPSLIIAIGATALLLATTGTAVAAPETIYLDTHEVGVDGAAGPVTTTAALAAGQTYVITVTGTSSAYADFIWDDPHRPTCETPAFPAEPLPKFYSPGVNHYKVGQDAAFIFARPRKPGTFCPALPKRIPHFQIQTDSGSGFVSVTPDGNPATPNKDHRYTYTVTGQGQPVSFRYNDTNTQDNYGEYEIVVPSTPVTTTADSTNTPGGGGGTGDSTVLPKPKLVVFVRGISFDLKPPQLLAAGSTSVGCGVTFGTLTSCVLHLRAAGPTKVTRPTGTLRLGTLLGERSATSIGRPFVRMHMRLTKAGRYALRSRPLGLDVVALAVAGGTNADSALGTFHLLAGPRFVLRLKTRSRKLPAKTLKQLDRIAGLLTGAKQVTCNGHTNGGNDLVVSARQAAAACTRIKAAGFKGATNSVGRGHAKPSRKRLVITFAY